MVCWHMGYFDFPTLGNTAVFIDLKHRICVGQGEHKLFAIQIGEPIVAFAEPGQPADLF